MQAPEQSSETQTVLKPSQHGITLLIWIPFQARINRMDSFDVLWDLLLLGALSQVPDLIVIQDLHDLQAHITCLQKLSHIFSRGCSGMFSGLLVDS